MTAPSPVSIRRARPADREAMLAWRNDERVRRFVHDPRPIDPAEHARWFARALRSRRRVLLVAEQGEVPLGVVRYDLDGATATISVYLVPDRIGQGWGASVIDAGSAWLRRHRPGVRLVRAEVRFGNEASFRAFRKAGFEERFATLERPLDDG
jgi:RimJ/RimL family protein N-acetyltransferase